jgi:DNA-binding transcriptional MocR family regulator
VPKAIAQAVSEPTAAGIVRAVTRLVESGALPPGTRLPTVRELAAALDVSPNTVAKAWSLLDDRRIITTRGRGGTLVADPGERTQPKRFFRLGTNPGSFACDLSTGVPDAELLPSLKIALEAMTDQTLVSSYHGPPVLPELEEVVRDDLRSSFQVEALTIVDGALDAIDRLLALLGGPGRRVVVEEPTFPAIIDLVEANGCVPLGVAVDEDGPGPKALAAALRRGADVVVLQPRAHNPTGARLTEHRAGELAQVLHAAPEVVVIEDDHTGDVSSVPLYSLATLLPDRTVYVRSYSKSHGPDLRLAVVAGPAPLVERLASRRRLGPSWSSRLLQGVLYTMLTDSRAQQAVARARDIYARRRTRLQNALHARGMKTTGADGINLWVPVSDEADALVSLAAAGIGVAPGAPFFICSPSPAHIRVTCGLLENRVDEVGDAIAEAARSRQLRVAGPSR